MEQARVAAANMCGGDKTYASIPWFWSDQYELKLQMVGFSSDGETQVVDLLDTQDFQSITPLPVRTEWVKITIYSVYPDYIWADAALSEVRLYGLVE